MSEQNLEARIEKLERYVNMLLVTHANPNDPMSEEECAYVKAIMQRVGWRGYQIVADHLAMDKAVAEHVALKRRLELLEQDFPKLKEKNT